MEEFLFKKKYGQNFLRDNNIINKIVNGSLVDKDTLVIEVGPGSGAITKYVVPKAGYAILYEIDESLKETLNNVLDGNDNYRIIFGDFLKSDIKNDIRDIEYKKLYVVANLPYYITTPIIEKFIDSDVIPDKFVIMVQKEVGDRLGAKVGSHEYGSLTVFLNYFYDISKLCDVSRNCFYPSPNVDSAVMVMDKKDNINKVRDMDLFKRFVRDAFRFKRKTLRNNLKGYDMDIINRVLSKYDMDVSVRAEAISLEIFIDIVNNLSN